MKNSGTHYSGTTRQRVSTVRDVRVCSIAVVRHPRQGTDRPAWSVRSRVMSDQRVVGYFEKKCYSHTGTATISMVPTRIAPAPRMIR